MVGSAGNAPVVIFQHCFVTAGLQTAGWITSHIDSGSGGGRCAHGGRAYEARLNLILPAMNWWSPAGNAPAWHCLQGRRFTFQPRPHEIDLAGRLGAAPSGPSFGDSVAQAGARPVKDIGAVAGNCTRLVAVR